MIDLEEYDAAKQDWQNRSSKPEPLYRMDKTLFSRYQVAGTDVICPICGHNYFEPGSGLINSSLLTFLHLDWLDKTATTLRCYRCGHLLWFKDSGASSGWAIIIVLVALFLVCGGGEEIARFLQKAM